MHSQRQANGIWSPKFIGRQGDGMNLQSRTAKDGQLHMLFRINRFNTDPVPSGYLVWHPQHGELVREILNGTDVVGGRFDLDVDGKPVAIARRFDSSRRVFEQRMVRRTNEGWKDFQSLPIVDPLTWRIGPDGKTYLVEWQPGRHELSLLQGHGDIWDRSLIVNLGPMTRPVTSVLLFDRAGTPVVVASGPAEPYGWSRIFRQNPQ